MEVGGWVVSLGIFCFQKGKKFGWGVGGWVGEVSSIHFFFWIFGIFLTLQSPLQGFEDR